MEPRSTWNTVPTRYPFHTSSQNLYNFQVLGILSYTEIISKKIDPF